MTVHCAKGLEFENVFIVGLEENIFPHSMSIMEDPLVEEERRLMYVATTRAKRNLFLTTCKERLLYGRENINLESRFISEIKPELIEIIERNINFNPLRERKILNKDDYYKEDNEEYHEGDNVFHDNFGLGKVIKVEKSVMTIAFKLPFGIKTLMKNHRSIRKV